MNLFIAITTISSNLVALGERSFVGGATEERWEGRGGGVIPFVAPSSASSSVSLYKCPYYHPTLTTHNFPCPNWMMFRDPPEVRKKCHIYCPDAWLGAPSRRRPWTPSTDWPPPLWPVNSIYPRELIALVARSDVVESCSWLRKVVHSQGKLY